MSGRDMLFYHIYYVQCLCGGMLMISLLAATCAVYAASMNSLRSSDDPEKKEFHPVAIFLVFFTWPAFLFLIVFLFIARALFYGFFFIFFTIFLIFTPREASEPTWLEQKAASIGEWLLQANMGLLKLFLRPWVHEAETI